MLLEPRHVGDVQRVLDAFPERSLRSLVPLVREACGLPSMNVATLSRFVTCHELRRQQPACIAIRSQRAYGELTAEHLDLVASLYRQTGVWGVLAALEATLGFRVSKEALWRFMDANNVPRRVPGQRTSVAGGAA